MSKTDKELREWLARLARFEDDGRRYFVTDHDNNAFRCDPQTIGELIEELLELRQFQREIILALKTPEREDG